MTDDLCFLSAAEAGRRIATRRLSAVEHVQAIFARIATIDGSVRAYITPLRDRAMAAARRAETDIAAGLWRGPLHGVGFAVKDNYFTAGIRTTGGSRLMLDVVPDATAHIITRLEAAGPIWCRHCRSIARRAMRTWPGRLPPRPPVCRAWTASSQNLPACSGPAPGRRSRSCPRRRSRS